MPMGAFKVNSSNSSSIFVKWLKIS
ncbi:hypothetical protein CY0110_15762 [Crocosphaera chwakensis CCY0110]|uniref:Uncharacterized protein n=1 Tax=Crocosphaera chwakensis CCY0110 TaxID=391612 RepID=A3IHI4_9CHRO|nr:hypothetical protein CY0110_15762 [Crocosphaera chwakensis CCY0110]